MEAMEKSVHTLEYAAVISTLRDLRASAGLSQRALATRLRVPHSWVAKVESGERRIDLVEFCWFVDACETDPGLVFDKLFGELLKKRSGRPGKARRTGGLERK
jgi:transcriptional regulator with XRE-family HTH domain